MQGVREKLNIPKPAQKPVRNKLEDLEGVNELVASLTEFNVELCVTCKQWTLDITWDCQVTPLPLPLPLPL